MDKYAWRVVFRDGSTLSEFDAEGTEHGWAEVDANNVAEIRLLGTDSVMFSELIPEGHTAVFTRRRIIPPNAVHYTIHVLGHRGSSEQYTFLFEDGHRVVSSNFDEF